MDPKACPVCGGEGKINEVEGDVTGAGVRTAIYAAQVYCEKCGKDGPDEHGNERASVRDAAVNAWNE